jgi:hypothetical protein
MSPVTPRPHTRLRTEPIIWLTTVTPAARPQTTQLWFLWRDGEFPIYGAASGRKPATSRLIRPLAAPGGQRQGRRERDLEGSAAIGGPGPWQPSTSSGAMSSDAHERELMPHG